MVDLGPTTWDPTGFLDRLVDNVVVVQPETEYRKHALVHEFISSPEPYCGTAGDPKWCRHGEKRKRCAVCHCNHKSGTPVESCVTGETVAWICDSCGEQFYDNRWIPDGS